MIRKPIVSGSFYPSDFGNLVRSIEKSFEGDLGPATLPSKRTSKKIIAIIAPHAGYAYSGQCAAWSYKEIGESRIADAYIILAPNHTGIGGSEISLSDFQTPLGTAINDYELSKKISELSGIKTGEDAHKGEHAIEVQLPFLLFSCKEKLNTIKIVPIVVSGDADTELLGESIYNAAQKLKKDITIIVSSDFTHYGYNYSYFPYGTGKGAKDTIKNLEKKAIDEIKEKNLVNLKGLIKKTSLTICGIYPIYTLISYLKKYEKDKKTKINTEYLQGYFSSEIDTESKDNFVSYKAIKFEEI